MILLTKGERNRNPLDKEILKKSSNYPVNFGYLYITNIRKSDFLLCINIQKTEDISNRNGRST